MAAAVASGRAFKSGIRSRFLLLNRLDSNRPISELATRPEGKHLCFVDTLALVRRLEADGVPPKQAEAFTAAMSGVFNESLANVVESFVSKSEMQKNVMTQEANFAQFETLIKSSQDHSFSLLQHEMEKLKNDTSNIRSEFRYEIDKVTASQRLDLNLERGRIRDELNNQSQRTSNLTNKLDREIQQVRAYLEETKYEVIKYTIGTFISASAVGLALIRILM